MRAVTLKSSWATANPLERIGQFKWADELETVLLSEQWFCDG
jgi:hypothetical protein